MYKLSNGTHQAGLATEMTSSTQFIKTLKIIYNQPKGSHLYYEVLMQGANQPNYCDNWEVKLNKDINCMMLPLRKCTHAHTHARTHARARSL